MPTKVIAGRVNADGSVEAGSGAFFLRHIANGTYIVEFNSPLENIPTVVIKGNWLAWSNFEFAGGNTLDNAVLVAVDKKGFKLITGDHTGAKVDRNFSFIAAAAASHDSIPGIVWGEISRTGGLRSGSGFSCQEAGDGVFIVSFNPDFSELWGVVVTPNHPDWDNFDSSGGKTLDNAVIVAADKSSVKYITGDSTGTKVDRNCSFVAVGKPPVTQPAPRLLFGSVNADGGVRTGSGGYEVIHKTDGTYEIGFNTPFPTSPAVLLTENWHGWSNFRFDTGKTTDNCVVVAVDRTRVKIITGDHTGAKADRNFCFLAVGA